MKAIRTVSFSVPGRPTSKNRRRVKLTRRGTIIQYPEPHQKRAQTNFAAEAKLRVPRGMKPHDGPVRMDVRFFFAAPKRLRKYALPMPHDRQPDRGNLLKLVDDALKGICFTDDARVFTGLVEKWYDTEDSTEILLTFYGEDDDDGAV